MLSRCAPSATGHKSSDCGETHPVACGPLLGLSPPLRTYAPAPGRSALLSKHTKPPAVLHPRLGAYFWVRLSNGLYLTLSSESIGAFALGFRLKLMSPCFLKQMVGFRLNLASGAYISVFGTSRGFVSLCVSQSRKEVVRSMLVHWTHLFLSVHNIL